VRKERARIENGHARLSHDQREQGSSPTWKDIFRTSQDASCHGVKSRTAKTRQTSLVAARMVPLALNSLNGSTAGKMGAAKGRESQRDNIRRAVCEDWQAQHQPRNFNLVVLMPNWNLRISRSDEAHLRQEFFTCAEGIDKAVLGGS
jgi:hypothetical protein